MGTVVASIKLVSKKEEYFITIGEAFGWKNCDDILSVYLDWDRIIPNLKKNETTYYSKDIFIPRNSHDAVRRLNEGGDEEYYYMFANPSSKFESMERVVNIGINLDNKKYENASEDVFSFSNIRKEILKDMMQ